VGARAAEVRPVDLTRAAMARQRAVDRPVARPALPLARPLAAALRAEAPPLAVATR